MKSMSPISKIKLFQSPALSEKKLKKLVEYSRLMNVFVDNERAELTDLHEVANLIQAQQNPLRRLSTKSKGIREKTFDWLLVVNYRLEFLNQTYFLTTDIMDIMLSNFKIADNEDHIHAFAITCLLIANKMEEVQQITVEQTAERIGHGKFDKETLLKTEQFIMKKLKYKLPRSQFCDFAHALIQHLSSQNELRPKKVNSNDQLPSINLFVSSPKKSKQNLQNGFISKFHISGQKVSYKDVTQTTGTKKEDTLRSDIDKEYENIIYLFAISVFKMMRFEYDLYKDTNKLLLYFAVVYFSANQVNQILGFKGKTCFSSLFNTAEVYNLKMNNIEEFSTVLSSVYEKNKGKYKYLKELEMNHFINEM